MTPLRLSLSVVLITAIYAFGHFFWYMQTPLGLSPVLDGQENLLIAQSIADGTLAQEPFYRAMLYPAFLSLFFSLGLSYDGVVSVSGVLGIFFHIGLTVICLRLSWSLWKNCTSILVTGLFVGLNPVLIHFSGDPLDVALGCLLFFGGICLMMELGSSQTGGRIRFASGFLLGMAPLARPHFFAPLLAIYFLILVWVVLDRSRLKATVSVLGGSLLPLFVYGLIQLSWGGAFGVLPWQGAYNLWASNKPEANGLYLKQSVFIHDLGEHRNPTRVESEILYKNETGGEGTISEQSAYWRSKTISSVLENPGQWTKLMIWKAYALANNYEQYNNKTFAFHKERSPWLRGNPISTGILFVLASGGMLVLFYRRPKVAQGVLLLALAYAVGLMIYMVSARFRVPLLPVMAILSGGVSLYPSIWKKRDRSRRLVVLSVPIVFAVVTFSNIGNVASRDTEIQDFMLLADSSAKLGRDEEAIQWSEKALEIDPNRGDALRIKVISFYNLVASGRSSDLKHNWNSFEGQLGRIVISDPIIDYVKGVALWNQGKKNVATEVWQAALAKYEWGASACLGALLLSQPDLPSPQLPKKVEREISLGYHGELGAAMCMRNPQLIDALGVDRYQRIRLSLENVIPNE
ncbi:tetratricopeptide repeat protein [Puniceicoccaceae bacterium K14]|nr:tetratricopeptide repeat protein [Puniceicoccaceae bacterium K14]